MNISEEVKADAYGQVPPPIQFNCHYCNDNFILELKTQKHYAFYRCKGCNKGAFAEVQSQIKSVYIEGKVWIFTWKEKKFAIVKWWQVQKYYDDEINYNAAKEQYWASRYDCRTVQREAA